MNLLGQDRATISTGYLSVFFIILVASSTFVSPQSPTPEPTPRVTFNDSRYIKYKALRDEYADLYEEYTTPDADGSIQNTLRRQAIRARVRQLNKEVDDLYKQDDFMDQTRPGEFSEELTKRLGSLRGATGWSQDAGPQEDLKRKYKRRIGRVDVKPYRTYLQKQDIFDRLKARFAEGGLTAAQKKAALDSLQKDVIDSLTHALELLNQDRDAPQSLINLIRELKSDADTLKSQNRPTADLDRQAFILELERHKKEVIDAAKAFGSRYESRTIRATYLTAFLKAGRDDWNGYVNSWSDTFWVRYVEGQTSITLFRGPIDVLTESANNLRNGRPFSRTDVAYFRQRMGLLRGRWASLTLAFDQYIQLEGETNADRFLLSRSKTMSEEQFQARQAARKRRSDQLIAEIKNLTKERAFAYSVGAPSPPPRSIT